MKKELLILFCCVFAAIFTGCEKDNPTDPTEESGISVQTPGTLSSLISAAEKYELTSLKLTGNLNGDDIRFIREMAGSDVNGNETSGKLAVLDLSGANIVEGGDYYLQRYGDYYTVKNSISEGMFYGCKTLTSITIPNSVTSIDGNFKSCIKLKEIIAASGSNSYSSIDGVLFNKAKTTLITYPIGKEGTNYTIPNSVTTIKSIAFYGCTKLTAVTMPNGITTIENAAFAGCTGIEYITIPNGVTTIDFETFAECSGLKHVIFGSGVTSIEDFAFSGCTGLLGMNLLDNPVPPICGPNAFYNVNKANCTISVLIGYLQAYQESEDWSEFGNIVGVIVN